MTIESIQIIEALRFGLKPFNQFDNYDEKSALYAIAFNGSEFPKHFGENKIIKGDIIYVGKTESGLRNRIIKTHFKDGRTNSSTLRRSLGAILIDNLSLKPIPNIRDFKFIHESEKSAQCNLYPYERKEMVQRE